MFKQAWFCVHEFVTLSQRHSCDDVTFLVENISKQYCNAFFSSKLQNINHNFLLQMSHRHSCDAVTFCSPFIPFEASIQTDWSLQTT